MGYYSEVMIAVTKKDFKKIEKEQIKIPDNYFCEELYKYYYKETQCINYQTIFVLHSHCRSLHPLKPPFSCVWNGHTPLIILFIS